MEPSAGEDPQKPKDDDIPTRQVKTYLLEKSTIFKELDEIRIKVISNFSQIKSCC
jgi:hypothetical protein